MNGKRKILPSVIVLAALLLGSCAPAAPQAAAQPVFVSATPLPLSDTPLPPTPTSPPPTETRLPPTETPVTPTTKPFEHFTPVPTVEGVNGKVEVNEGLQMYYECFGEGEPTVMIEVGFGTSLDDWHRVMYMIAQHTRTCATDRLGFGQSNYPTTTRTSQDMVDNLNTVLSKAIGTGPYILVGHSLGGYNVLLYANQYPEEVAGMVLIDPSHPDRITRLLDSLPTASPGEPTILTACRKEAEKDMKNWNRPDHAGRWDFAASDDQVRTVTSLGDMPLVILTAEQSWRYCSDEYGELQRQIWRDLHGEYAKLSSNGTQILAEGDTHSIYLGDPQLVTDTVLQMVEKIRGD